MLFVLISVVVIIGDQFAICCSVFRCQNPVFRKMHIMQSLREQCKHADVFITVSLIFRLFFAEELFWHIILGTVDSDHFIK